MKRPIAGEGDEAGSAEVPPPRRVTGEGLDSQALTEEGGHSGGRGSVYRGEEGDMLQRRGSSGGPSVCTWECPPCAKLG